MIHNQTDLPSRLGALVLAVLRECAAGQDDVIITYSGGAVTVWASHGRTDARILTLTPVETTFLMLDRGV